MNQTKPHLFSQRDHYKPFNYPWCYQAWLKHEQSHWLFSEVPMIDDVNDWKRKLTSGQKQFLTHIFRFFTQGDIDVAEGYVERYLPNFPQPEVRMMLLGFASREALHIAAYSHLIETLGMPETTYSEFLKYKEMKDKHEYLHKITYSGKENQLHQLSLDMAVFSAFTEGMQLFSSFIMLLNFPRHGLMKGMGQIITWSIVDEAVISGTEVLTTTGWKPIENLSLSDKIYQFDMQNKETSFVYPEKIQRVQRNESYVFESDTIHQHVSPNHRMIVMNKDGTIGETKAFECQEDAILILSGDKKIGDDVLTDEDKLAIQMILEGTVGVEWIYNKIPFVSKIWAKAATEYYLSLITTKTIEDAFNTLANIAGGVIRNGVFEEKEVTSITKTKLSHEVKDFYCVAVPGKAFFIRSNDKISVTGNTQHTEAMIKLFRTLIEENRAIWGDDLKSKIYDAARAMVTLEDNFIDLAFGIDSMMNLTADEVKQYVRYIADRRLIAMGLKGVFKVKKNPLPWVETMINSPIHTNFFEQRSTDYAKGALSGSWSDVWGSAA